MIYRVYKILNVSVILLYFSFICCYSDTPKSIGIRSSKEKPTKVFIVLFDALRPDHMSCYGYNRKTTPSIDKLAFNGVIFENHYTQGLNTFFSVPTILYSRYFPPMLHESLDSIECRRQPDNNEKLITEIFKENGYRTVFITTHSWFSKDSPLVRSFDESILVQSDSDTVPSFEDLNKELFPWLEKNKDEKFFVYIHLVDTHFPHLLSPPYDKWVTEELKINITEERRKELALGMNERDILKPLTSYEVDFLNAIYDGSLLYTDHQLSVLVQKLEEINIFDDTIFFLISDHGELLGEDGMLWGHPPIAYDTMLKTPLIVFGKGIPNNVKINEITENVDIVPTIIELLQLKTNAKFDGRSILPYMLNNHSPAEPRTYAFSKCFYLEPEAYLNLMSIEKGYESHQMFILTDTKFKLEYHEIDNAFYFWTKENEQEFINNKMFSKEKKFPNLNLSEKFPNEYENAKIYLQNTILPKYKNYKEKSPEIYYIPFSPFTIPKYVVNKNDLISHSGEYEKYPSDNKWGFDIDGFVIWTQPWQETVNPLQLTFDIQQGEYEVYIKIPCMRNFYGHPLSSVYVSIANNPPILIDKSDCEHMKIEYQKAGLAKVDKTTKFNISFEPGDKNTWCNIMAIKLVQKKSNITEKQSLPPEINGNNNDIKDKIKLPTEDRINQLKSLGYL